MMKIGKLSLETVERNVGEVDVGLLASTGLSAREMRNALGYYCAPGVVASAVVPMLKDPPHRAELARAIAAEDVNKVRPQVRKLYDELLAEAPAAAASAEPVSEPEAPKEAPRGSKQRG
jgi:hypothetical protein